MVAMLSASLKPAITRAINPIARGALRLGLTPNAVTAIGALGVVFSSLYFYPRQEFFWGTIAISIFALSDLFDGAMARISQKGASRWGGFLDSIALAALVAGGLVSYIRAKAESLNIECSGGIAERTERLILALTAIGFDGLGVPYALTIGIWSLLILATVTVAQRILIVKAAI